MLKPPAAGVAGSTSEQPIASTDRAPLRRIALLIPCWKPTPHLPALVTKLAQRGFGLIVILDDGSPATYGTVFSDLSTLPTVVVLRHATNEGKGRALRTGFQYLLDFASTRPELTGVVTADADGQHLPEDIERVAQALLQDGGRVVLGVRTFDQAVPWRNRIGNILTRKIFTLVTGTTLTDTQTGLRGFPLATLPSLVSLKGDRYEYETTMLVYLCRQGQPPVEVPITTVYLDHNQESHFHPVWDALRIYVVLFRFYLSSLFTTRPTRQR